MGSYKKARFRETVRPCRSLPDLEVQWWIIAVCVNAEVERRIGVDRRIERRRCTLPLLVPPYLTAASATESEESGDRQAKQIGATDTAPDPPTL